MLGDKQVQTTEGSAIIGVSVTARGKWCNVRWSLHLDSGLRRNDGVGWNFVVN